MIMIYMTVVMVRVERCNGLSEVVEIESVGLIDGSREREESRMIPAVFGLE